MPDWMCVTVADPVVAIVNTGVGNLFSITRALEEVGATPRLVSQPAELKAVDRIVIPGVGAFATTMATFESTGLADALRDFAASDRPILGICLGMQLLMSAGYEDGYAKGLEMIAGEAVPLPQRDIHGKQLRVPHIGWSRVLPVEGSTSTSWPGTQKVPVDVYFAHSFRVNTVSADIVAGVFTYGGHELTGVLRDANLWGVQFHPERSGPAGLEILRQFTL